MLTFTASLVLLIAADLVALLVLYLIGRVLCKVFKLNNVHLLSAIFSITIFIMMAMLTFALVFSLTPGNSITLVHLFFAFGWPILLPALLTGNFYN